MYEKQFSSKDLIFVKNNISEKLGSEYNVVFEDKMLNILNSKNKMLFKGEFSSNPMGIYLKGEFKIEKIISRITLVIVFFYIIFLLTTYILGSAFYDYQILLMIIAVFFIMIIKRINGKDTDVIKGVFDKI